MIGLAALLVLVGGAVLLGVAGLLRPADARTNPAIAMPRWDWRLTLLSTPLYALAFNLTFFIQELFLVVPKALTPGLRPTLYHNNHHWDGTNPLADLFQGTGALATIIAATVCALLLRVGAVRSVAVRLFLVWMAYCGFFMALPQVIVGALSPDSDVGRAMSYFELGTNAKTLAALVAVVLIPLVALAFLRPLLALAGTPATIAIARARTRFIFEVATMPALFAIVLIVPFRVPRELVEVVVLPAVVSVIGIAWIQAGAWRVDDAKVDIAPRGAMAWPATALLLLFLFFQFVLRPGIRFY
jgi:hypothetical protein